MLMKCGCDNAGAVMTATGEPVCIAHLGIHPGATEVADVLPDLTGRKAKCCREVDSNFNLPFFVYRPGTATDSYYCGHSGWD